MNPGVTKILFRCTKQGIGAVNTRTIIRNCIKGSVKSRVSLLLTDTSYFCRIIKQGSLIYLATKRRRGCVSFL